MIKVFLEDKTICFISDQKDYKQEADSVLVKINSFDELPMMQDELVNKNNFKQIYFLYENETLLLERFSTSYKLIEAAGGLVKNSNGEYLFIFRNGKWDLPKGKIEKGETIKVAAIREVEEECGIGKLQIIKELDSTYHTYFLEKKPVLKRTYWFEMSSDDNSTLVPQTEEGITDVKWLSKNEMKQVLENTFASIKEVMKQIH